MLLLFGLATLIAPRKHAILPYILVASFIPCSQRLVVFSLDFFFLRIITMIATARVLLRNEYHIRADSMDWLMLVYIFIKTLIYTLQQQSMSAFVQQLGSSYDCLGMYFVFRCLIRSFDDLRGLALGLLLASIPVSIAFVIESLTGQNLFAFMGGVPAITPVRDGKVRCQGAFSTCGIAGVFWSSLLPLVAARWFDPRQNKLLTLVGTGCIVIIVITTNTSTCLMGLILGFIGACFFPLRKRMQTVRWGIIFILIGAQLYLGNVCYLIAKVNMFGGSTGWHRAYLMDRCCHYFHEWWLLGTTDTEHWAAGPLGGAGLSDVTNQYIIEAVRGGLATMLLFISLFVLAFKKVGIMLRAETVVADRRQTILVWSIGVMLMIHTIIFFSLSYFGQAGLLMWFCLGITTSLCDTVVAADRPVLPPKMSTGQP